MNNPVIFIDESGNVSIIATITIGAGVGALVSAGIVGEASARVLSAGFQKYFSTLTKVQQKEMLSKIGNITNRELKAIRQEISNGLTNDKLLELVETYGYDVIVSALVSSTTASVVQ